MKKMKLRGAMAPRMDRWTDIRTLQKPLLALDQKEMVEVFPFSGIQQHLSSTTVCVLLLIFRPRC